MTIHGEDCFLSYKSESGWVTFGGEKSCTVEADTEMIEVCSPTSGNAREYIPGKSGWRMYFNGLLLKNTDLFSLQRKREPINVRFNYGGKQMEGYGYISSVRGSSALHEMAQASMTITGTGDLV